MFRRDLIELLAGQPRALSELAELLDADPKELAEDIEHLRKSLKHTAYREVFEPAVCRKCGFVFASTRLRKPGKCPRCRATWVSEPKLGLEVEG